MIFLLGFFTAIIYYIIGFKICTKFLWEFLYDINKCGNMFVYLIILIFWPISLVIMGIWFVWLCRPVLKFKAWK